MIRGRLEALLGEPVDLRPVGGGCINDAVHVRSHDLFAKTNDRALPGQFLVEAAGLRAMRESGTRLHIPAVVHADEHLLVLEWLDTETRRTPDFDERLGRGLAEVHRATARAFGFERDGYCGATPQPNGWLDTWAEFYGARRLGHQIQLARRRLSGRDLQLLEDLRARLPRLLPDPEPPALVHGDLWSGNLSQHQGHPALVDPAPYYGHREAELGMMVLFGGFSQRVFAAYDEAFPLQPGWRERLPLYTLYHVLNHGHLFGGGYDRQALGIARSLL